MTNCVFCNIVQGIIPCHKVFEDDKSIVFLTIEPVNPGHCLVVPKKHYESFDELPEDLLKHLIGIVQKAYNLVNEKLCPDGVNIVQNNGRVAGQMVPHVHFHIIPRIKGDESRYKVLWNTEKATSEELDKVLEKLI